MGTSSVAAAAANKRIGNAPLYFVTPVKDEPEATVAETLHSLLDQGVYVFGEKTAGRAVLRAGDGICFYHSGVGIVAEARIASVARKEPVSFVKHPDSYPWAFDVKDVHYHLEDPVVIDAELRAQLDGFKDKDPAANWSWFVQGTRYVTAHDFKLLTLALPVMRTSSASCHAQSTNARRTDSSDNQGVDGRGVLFNAHEWAGQGKPRIHGGSRHPPAPHRASRQPAREARAAPAGPAGIRGLLPAASAQLTRSGGSTSG